MSVTAFIYGKLQFAIKEQLIRLRSRRRLVQTNIMALVLMTIFFIFSVNLCRQKYADRVIY